MKIEYELGEEVWVLHDNKPKRGFVYSIVLTFEKEPLYNVYNSKVGGSMHYGDFNADKIGSTKRELLEKIFYYKED